MESPPFCSVEQYGNMSHISQGFGKNGAVIGVTVVHFIFSLVTASLHLYMAIRVQKMTVRYRRGSILGPTAVPGISMLRKSTFLANRHTSSSSSTNRTRTLTSVSASTFGDSSVSPVSEYESQADLSTPISGLNMIKKSPLGGTKSSVSSFSASRANTPPTSISSPSVTPTSSFSIVSKSTHCSASQNYSSYSSHPSQLVPKGLPPIKTQTRSPSIIRKISSNNSRKKSIQMPNNSLSALGRVHPSKYKSFAEPASSRRSALSTQSAAAMKRPKLTRGISQYMKKTKSAVVAPSRARNSSATASSSGRSFSSFSRQLKRITPKTHERTHTEAIRGRVACCLSIAHCLESLTGYGVLLNDPAVNPIWYRAWLIIAVLSRLFQTMEIYTFWRWQMVRRRKMEALFKQAEQIDAMRVTVVSTVGTTSESSQHMSSASSAYSTIFTLGDIFTHNERELQMLVLVLLFAGGAVVLNSIQHIRCDPVMYITYVNAYGTLAFDGLFLFLALTNVRSTRNMLVKSDQDMRKGLRILDYTSGIIAKIIILIGVAQIPYLFPIFLNTGVGWWLVVFWFRLVPSTVLSFFSLQDSMKKWRTRYMRTNGIVHPDATDVNTRVYTKGTNNRNSNVRGIKNEDDEDSSDSDCGYIGEDEDVADAAAAAALSTA